MPAPSVPEPSPADFSAESGAAAAPARHEALPLDGDSILALAARSMFQLFSSISQGMFLVDHTGRIVWVNEGYRRFLPALGFSSIDQFQGHLVEEVIQNTQMRRVLETGEPIMIDLLTNKAGTFVVSRLPLRDEGGAVIGAIGIVLFDHPETTLKPLISKFARLQQDLDDARRELAVQRKRELSAPDGQRRAKYTFASFVGTSPAAVEVKRQARRAAQSASPVLLLGETGTGKELLAHALHTASSRASGPFVSVNIAAVPDTLLEAEFFGVAPGAYTGADRKGREGKFRLADGGTLFLDEIGDMPLNLQAKLLRALQEGEIEPLGSNRLLPFDARVIAATSRDLAALVREGRFREDLYYRLGVLPIRVPPLRERVSDIVALVEVLGEDMALRNSSAPPELSPQAIALLQAQPWRGNIRELRNVLEQAALRSESGQIDVGLLQGVLQDSGLDPVLAVKPPPVPGPAMAFSAAPVADHTAPVGLTADVAAAAIQPLAEQVAALEQQAIARALHHTRGNKVAAARLLGISRATLYERLGEGR
ncbi:sigma 54-interacting transcriptional regulator [Curvibacter sp. RS43]|uniref:sigma-54 interaction domain-containing protein n=1 Tax=Curvibacter microcysteis TaxID=3026419 RepID=UPI00235EB643|nr:sigma 54-interacting transcriptional regulator [Curvibacter sp. RS43]MDD0809623.1 sigma 54-interacting transcriptional regulator [Curvibacter sp. RS43]